ncbi:hypothetical protein SASPL_139883 [Salvia splendens]|uniref:Uncharacterized protein n=1 Tax=Salvia splendens TaxID=180675 RepID=A0A8X8WNR9_SALSN|nr:hypothetical protein SASPL_139883 [Salvia splendens]
MVAAFKVVDNAVVVIDYAETKSRVSNIEMENKAILRHKTRNRAVAAKNVKIAEVRSFSGEVDDERPWQLTTRASDSQGSQTGEGWYIFFKGLLAFVALLIAFQNLENTRHLGSAVCFPLCAQLANVNAS